MHTRKLFLVAGAVLCAAMALPAAADRAFARAKGCLTCHDIDMKIVGPSFKEIAQKYKGEKDAPAQMTTSIVKGSKGKWGSVEMPPNNVSAEEAKKLADWILTQ